MSEVGRRLRGRVNLENYKCKTGADTRHHQAPNTVLLQRISQAGTAQLDRWRISINDEERDKSEAMDKTLQHCVPTVPYNIINNYFSIGVVSTQYLVTVPHTTHIITTYTNITTNTDNIKNRVL